MKGQCGLGKLALLNLQFRTNIEIRYFLELTDELRVTGERGSLDHCFCAHVRVIL